MTETKIIDERQDQQDHLYILFLNKEGPIELVDEPNALPSTIQLKAFPFLTPLLKGDAPFKRSEAKEIITTELAHRNYPHEEVYIFDNYTAAPLQKNSSTPVSPIVTKDSEGRYYYQGFIAKE